MLPRVTNIFFFQKCLLSRYKELETLIGIEELTIIMVDGIYATIKISFYLTKYLYPFIFEEW